jgi:threonine dehydrogenase-like Zn-dependent dehydrogenase
MRGVRHSTRGIEVLDLPEPEGDGVLVGVVSSSICGSDLSAMGRGALHHTLGHEFAGRLEDGSPVAIEPSIHCGTCDQCLVREPQRCRLGFEATIGFGRDGGMAERVRVPERCLVPLPEGLELRDACLVEPLACAIHGLRRVGLEGSGSPRVAVIGAGGLGLLSIAAAKAELGSVDVVARHAPQRAAAERLGAGEAEGEYDLVIDAAGSASALHQACALARPGSTLLLLGVYTEDLPIPGLDVLAKEITIVPATGYGYKGDERDVEAAAALLAANPEIAPTVISHRFPLEEAAEAYRVAADRTLGSLKVVVEP